MLILVDTFHRVDGIPQPSSPARLKCLGTFVDCRLGCGNLKVSSWRATAQFSPHARQSPASETPAARGFFPKPITAPCELAVTRHRLRFEPFSRQSGAQAK
jgi:hypothetical protein